MTISTNIATIEPAPKRSLLVDMAARYGMEPDIFKGVVMSTCLPNGGKGVTVEQFAAFLLVANEHRLNPMTREIYAFPAKGGGIQPIVGIDGWVRIINEQPALDGVEFQDRLDDKGGLQAVTCRIYRKDRSRPTEVTEYMSECKRNTDTWKQWPARMLRHKAMIQAARYAFGFSGLMDPDEYERMQEARTISTSDVRRLDADFSTPAGPEEPQDADFTVEDEPIAPAEQAAQDDAADKLERAKARTEAVVEQAGGPAANAMERFLARLEESIREAEDDKALEAIWRKSEVNREKAKERYPERMQALEELFDERAMEVAP